VTTAGPAVDSESALAARTLRSVLLGVLIYAIPFYAIEIPFFAVRKFTGGMLFLMVALAAAISLHFLKRGRLRLASWILLSAVSVFATTLVVLSGGISSPGLVIYVPIVIVAGSLLGVVFALAFTGLFVSLTLVLAVLESLGVHAPKYFPAPPISTWMVTLFFTAIAVVPLFQVPRTLRKSWTKAQSQPEEVQLEAQKPPDSEERYRRMAETALAAGKSESLRSVALGVGHDFNNLLAGILASAELVHRALPHASPCQLDIENIKTASLHGSEIATQLMTFAEEEPPGLEPLDLSAVVAEMLELLNAHVSKAATLKANLADDLPPVRANAAQMRQLIMNLVMNAFEAISKPPGLIHVSTRLVRPGGGPDTGTDDARMRDCVELEVRDNGSGIQPEVTNRIFEPFFTTKPSGHGLGLPLVKRIVRAHGGEIHVDSHPGEGTTFRVLIPVTESERDEDPYPSSLAEKQSRSEATTVLFVDDDPLLRKAVARGLRKRGFSVLEASDGDIALDMARERKGNIDLVLLDATLPGISSQEVSTQLLRIAPDAKVILTSAYSKDDVRTKLALGQIQFIRKPFRLADLEQLIRATLHT